MTIVQVSRSKLNHAIRRLGFMTSSEQQTGQRSTVRLQRGARYACSSLCLALQLDANCKLSEK